MLSIMFEFAWEVLKENRRAYFIINGVFYALVIGGMVYSAIDPSIQAGLIYTSGNSLTASTVSLIGKGYGAGQILLQIGMLFLINLMGSNLAGITLVSFIVPFSGLPLGAAHAIQLGLFFSPVDPGMRASIIMHWLTLALESQANILAMLGAYIVGRGVIWPQALGLTGRRAAYVEGLRQASALYTLIALVLAVAALYGILEVFVMSAFAG